MLPYCCYCLLASLPACCRLVAECRASDPAVASKVKCGFVKQAEPIVLECFVDNFKYVTTVQIWCCLCSVTVTPSCRMRSDFVFLQATQALGRLQALGSSLHLVSRSGSSLTSMCLYNSAFDCCHSTILCIVHSPEAVYCSIVDIVGSCLGPGCRACIDTSRFTCTLTA